MQPFENAKINKKNLLILFLFKVHTWPSVYGCDKSCDIIIIETLSCLQTNLKISPPIWGWYYQILSFSGHFSSPETKFAEMWRVQQNLLKNFMTMGG